MWTIPEYLYDRITKKYSDAAGGEGFYAKLFSCCTQEFKGEMGEMARFDEDEKGLICYYLNRESYVILTNRRLLWADGNCYQLDLSEIKSAGRPYPHYRIERKHEMKKLRVTTYADRHYDIEFEAGKPFFGFLNVMSMIARLRKG